MSDLALLDMRATLIGVHATAVGIGMLPASVLAGFLYDTFGAPEPFFLAGRWGWPPRQGFGC